MLKMLHFNSSINNLIRDIGSYENNIDDANRIQLNPIWQRTNQAWDLSKQQKLIYSIFNNISIPAFIFSRNTTKNCLESIDGQQRATTLRLFVKNQFKTGKEDFDNSEMNDKFFEELSQEKRNYFLNTYVLKFEIYEDLADYKKAEIFALVNNGKSLSKYEKINGEYSANFLYKKIKESSESQTHSYCINDRERSKFLKRSALPIWFAELFTYSYFETFLASPTVSLGYMSDSVKNMLSDAKNRDIDNLTDFFNKTDEKIKSVMRLLGGRTSKADNTVVFNAVVSYVATKPASKYSILSNNINALYKDLLLLSNDVVRLKEELDVRGTRDASYQTKLRKKIEKEVDLIFDIPNTQRQFSIFDKNLIFNRCGGKCVNCESTLNLEYDHIVPFSEGGLTISDNGQLLCRSCNASKGNSCESN